MFAASRVDVVGATRSQQGCNVASRVEGTRRLRAELGSATPQSSTNHPSRQPHTGFYGLRGRNPTPVLLYGRKGAEPTQQHRYKCKCHLYIQLYSVHL